MTKRSAQIANGAFYDLMKRRCQNVYYAFDIIWLNGRHFRSPRGSPVSALWRAPALHD
jgi:hypothetical protein